MTYHYHGIDAEESILTKSLPNLGTWALPNLFFMKLSANKSLHCPDYEMVCDRMFFGCFTPGGSFQSSSFDVTVKMTS